MQIGYGQQLAKMAYDLSKYGKYVYGTAGQNPQDSIAGMQASNRGERYLPRRYKESARKHANRIMKLTGKKRGRVRISGYYGRYNRNQCCDVELKFHDIDIIDTVIAVGGVIMNGGTVNIIPQGTEEGQRIGRKCTIKSIEWFYDVGIDTRTSPSQTSDIVRVVLYLDKQCNGAPATVLEIFEDAVHNSFLNLANQNRFSLLMDKTYSLNQMTAGGSVGPVFTSGTVEYHERFHKNCSIPIEFNSTLGAITEIRSNNIGVLLFSKRGLAGFNSKLRLRFQG